MLTGSAPLWVTNEHQFYVICQLLPTTSCLQNTRGSLPPARLLAALSFRGSGVILAANVGQIDRWLRQIHVQAVERPRIISRDGQIAEPFLFVEGMMNHGACSVLVLRSTASKASR